MFYMIEAALAYDPSVGPGLDPSHPLGVVSTDNQAETVGQARLVGWRVDGKKAIATYRLVIGCVELSNLFTCVGRRFEPLTA